ncbi:hypothetical protein M9H77_36300 [Catharanthus roseus]|uniref:Uncharacterized protein n=1 Tax=Catharanthus roseus TaxID=4058 RepID=A0ACB9ZSA1_CATRO|nr:hypothetical protein M9H77_36300 [Catharanthus roseus]
MFHYKGIGLDYLASRDPIFLPKVHGNTLAKVLEYCKHVVTQPPSDENDIDLKAFVSGLVNDHEETLFRLLHKDLEYICRIFNITPDFFSEEEEKMQRENLWAFN